MRERTAATWRVATGASLVGSMLASVAGTGAAQGARPPAADWSAVEQALGRKGTMQPGGVMRFGFPRRDLQVTANGVTIRPAFALGSWVAFERVAGGRAMLAGDLVLTEDEVGPVIRRLQEGGVEVTALHNHLLGETPRVMYLHIGAHGDPARAAAAVRAALGLTRTPMDTAAAGPAPAFDLDTALLARTLGHAGRVTGGVYQVSVPRAAPVREAGHVVPPAMGVATVINIQPAGDGRAAVTGDYVLTASEVNPVIRALSAGGITVTALHSHMLAETPRLFFMHFWGVDDPAALARTLRAALDRTASRRP